MLANAIDKDICAMNKDEFLLFMRKLCQAAAEAGDGESYRGGYRPGNIGYVDGEIVLGEPDKSGEDGWSKEVLEYMAPEIFWDGSKTAAADVYSLGLILFYGLNGGRLPFLSLDEDEPSPNARVSALKARMYGTRISAPSGLDFRLTSIVEKAVELEAEDRFASPAELYEALADYCDNVGEVELEPIAADDGGEAIYDDEARTELDEMIENPPFVDADAEVDAILKEIYEAEAAAAAAEVVTAEVVTEEASEEIAEAVEETAEAEEAVEDEEAIEEAPASEEAEEEAVEEETDAVTEGSAEAEEIAEEAVEEASAPDTPAEDAVEEATGEIAEEVDEPEEVVEEADASEEVAEAESAEEESSIEEEAAEIVDILEETPEEEADAEAEEEPSQDPKEAKIEAIAKDIRSISRDMPKAPAPQSVLEKRTQKKKRNYVPLIAAALLVAAIIAGVAVANSISRGKDPSAQVTPPPSESVQPTDEGKAEPGSTYQLFAENVSWEKAEESCREMGGHLVTIGDEAEYDKVCSLLSETHAKYIWIGCYRDAGELLWTSGETTDFAKWAKGEPSVRDGYDGAAEDYVMLVKQDDGTWLYNDSRNDPIAKYAKYYSGQIAYVCEITE